MKVAVIGATGAVGREMVADLETCPLPEIELVPFASPRSAGEMLRFRDKSYEVKAFSREALVGIPYVLMSAGGAFSREHGKVLAENAVVIDNSSAWRMDPGVPLVVPEVNGDLLEGFAKGLIANPNCSTIQMVVALKPLKDTFGLKRIHVATYQSVSGTGQKGIEELGRQLEAHMKFQDPEPKVYAQPIAFNLLPAIDTFDDAGHAFEETKMVLETRKIFRLPDLSVFATTVRVPTFNCHGEAVTVELAQEVTREEVLSTLAEGEGIVLVREDDHALLPTPRMVAGRQEVFVSRVRLPFGEARSSWVSFWNIADNLKKGAATNAVQILTRILGG